MSHFFKSLVQSYVYLLCLNPARNGSQYATVLTQPLRNSVAASQCVAVYCSVLQYVVASDSMQLLCNSGAASQFVAVCCSVLQCTVACCSHDASDSMQPLRNNGSALQYAAVAVAQRPSSGRVVYILMHCSILQHANMHASVLQYTAVAHCSSCATAHVSV